MHEREAPAISIQTEQKAACGFVCPAPRPLPRPRPPWQRGNVWEGAWSRALKREGDQLAVPAARPARRTAGLISSLAATYSPCARGAHSAPACPRFHFASCSPAVSRPPPSGPTGRPLSPRAASRLLSPRARRSRRGGAAGRARRRPSCLSGFRTQRGRLSAA